MDVKAECRSRRPTRALYTSQVLDPADAPASSLSSCHETRFSPTAKNYIDYRGNGTYTVLLRYFTAPDTTAPAPCRGRFRYTVNAGTRSPPRRPRCSREPPNTFVTAPTRSPSR